jgi:hypothetical protein
MKKGILFSNILAEDSGTSGRFTMDRLRDLMAQFFARVSKICRNSKPEQETVDAVDPAAETVAQVQQAILNGEPAPRLSDLKRNKPALRTTLHDMPSANHPKNYGKDRHWFDKAEYEQRRGASSNTFNRLEAFLSSTDPDQLSALDPSWNAKLNEAPDDRPQPKRASVDLPKIHRPQEPVQEEKLWQEGMLSESIS